MGENAQIDGNGRWALTFVSNTDGETIYNARINPVTGALLVEAVVDSTNTSIGSVIPGGTEGSVLFLGPGGTLDQDNANFFYDPTDHFLGLGTDTPGATLDLKGSFILDLGGDATGDIYYRNSSGFITALPIGSTGQVLTVTGGLPVWGPGGGAGTQAGIQFQDEGTNLGSSGTVTVVNFVGAGVAATRGGNTVTVTIPGGGSSGYNLFENVGVPVTARTTVNLTDLLTASDVAGATQLDINVANLANNTTFITDLTSNSTFISDITNIVTDVGWSLTGNAGTTYGTDFLGTTDATNLLIQANGGGNDVFVNASQFAVFTPTYLDGLLLVSDSGLWSIGDNSGDVNNTKIVGQDSAGTISINANNGTFLLGGLTFQKGNNVTINAPTSGSDYSLLLPTGQGDANTVLTNDGSGNLSWSKPSSIVDASIQSSLFDDFIGGSPLVYGGTGTTYVSSIGELGWYGDSTTQVIDSIDPANHPGVVDVLTNQLAPNGLTLGPNPTISAGMSILQIPSAIFESLVNVNSLGVGDANPEYFFGIADQSTLSGTNPMANSTFVKMGILIDRASGVWQGYVSDGTTQNLSGSTAVASVATWTKLRFVTDNLGANVEFFVNGVSIGSVSIPTTTQPVSPCYLLGNGNTTTGTGTFDLFVDYFLFNQSLTR